MNYFLVDGTEDCFYTAVFDGYKEKDLIITSERDVQLGLGYDLREIVTDSEKAERVKRKLNLLDSLATEDVRLILKSCDPLKESVAFEYIKLILKHNGAVRGMQADPRVLEATDIRSRVTGEAHRLKGFLRFMENADGVLYAPYSPDNDVTDILAVHFSQRLSSLRFVIHDIKRKIAGLYDGEQIIMTRVENAEIYLSEYENYFEELWKQYYKSVDIKSRPHEKQMKGYMPVRYWKFLPEKN
ncbi:MAG: TIGR03915 family putative DNA repair protein [Candidatus Coproplasma sp.]